MKINVLAVAALVAATGAIAAPPEADDAAERAATATPAEQASTTGAEAEPEPQEEKKICRTERATGSLTRRTRVCLSAAQWREVNSKTMRGVSEMQGQGSGGQVVQNNAGAGG